MQSWEWQYGQTLEFEHSISGKVDGKEAVRRYSHFLQYSADRSHQLVLIMASHGIIVNCEIRYRESEGEQQIAAELGKKLIGKRYGLLDLADFTRDELGLIEWLVHEM